MASRFTTIKLTIAEAPKGSAEYKIVRESVKFQVFESDDEQRLLRKLCAVVAQHHGQDQFCARQFLNEADSLDNPGVYEISTENVLLIAEDIIDLAFSFVRKEVRP
jgi:predicted nucleotidyltransferase